MLRLFFILLFSLRVCASMQEPRLNVLTGDRSVVLHWPLNQFEKANVLRAEAGSDEWVQIASALPKGVFADLEVANGKTYRYQVKFRSNYSGIVITYRAEATPKPFASDDQFLDYLQHCNFLYFWYEANPVNGLIKDRSRTNSFCSIAANGFGMTALIIGVDRGWITRQEARDRILTTIKTFHQGKQGEQSWGVIGHRGWFYHFLDMERGYRFRQVELSSIDTGLLLAGMLDARQFFDGDSAGEKQIRELVNAIYERIDWQWMLNGGDAMSMGWHPESGFIEKRWIGYNEAMILNIMAMGAPKNALPEKTWAAWTSEYQWKTHYGYSYLEFAPLFGHQYSHCWIDFRGLADDYMRGKGIDYFENSRRATLAQRKYCIENPGKFKGYSADCWGLTACDGPERAGYKGYAARGAPPAEHDDGTIAPTAVGGSVPFAPEICIPTLRNFYEKYREKIWTQYGFRDAFNLTADWWDPEMLGIDQGPIVIMIENHRTGSVWRRFMQIPEIQRGMEKAGFKPLPKRAVEVEANPADLNRGLTKP